MKWSQNTSDFNPVKLNSWAVTSYQVENNMLHMLSALCAAHDLHKIVPWLLERTYKRQFTAQ